MTDLKCNIQYTGGKKVLRTDDLCDRHEAYASNKKNTSKDVYVLKLETDKFHADKTLVFDLDEDVIYRREDLKDGVQAIGNKDMRYKQYDYGLQFGLIKIPLHNGLRQYNDAASMCRL